LIFFQQPWMRFAATTTIYVTKHFLAVHYRNRDCHKAAGPIRRMHFFNPAYVMKLVEIVRGSEPPTTPSSSCANWHFHRKEPVEVSEAPGFVVNVSWCP
jgi:3-hydroxyacyl-CoA dehydrogenase